MTDKPESLGAPANGLPPVSPADHVDAGTAADAPERDLSVPHALEHDPQTGVGLCLSGGGYRAMVFHLGALRRLNETGWLSKLTKVASVSGGSITAGVLALGWKQLQFEAGVATNFDEFVADPLLEFATRTVDWKAALFGPLFWGGASKVVAAAYDKYLFHGATLQQLPASGEGPEFTFLATNLSNAKLWRFTRDLMRDWKTPPIHHPTLSVATAVAASSAFPPFLSPVKLDLPNGRRITLTDGGVFDNLGLAPVLKYCGTVFVSDGGGAYAESAHPATDWFLGTIRVLQAINAQVGSLRHSEIAAALNSGRRKGGLWTCVTAPSEYSGWASTVPMTDATAAQIGATKTRLAKMSDSTRYRLANFGYAIADATLRTYVDQALPEPTGFPYPVAFERSGRQARRAPS